MFRRRSIRRRFVSNRRNPVIRNMQIQLKIVLSVALLLSPVAASAQTAIAGTVRDASGAVLPGVTVDTSSPALIEKTRSVVTDDQGQYKIIDLRPGMYKVTF